MRNKHLILLAVIAVLLLAAIYVNLPNGPGLHLSDKINLDMKIKEGLDLRGGLSVLLQADVPSDQKITSAQIGQVKTIISNRVNTLGVTEPLVQTQGSRRIIVELPGISVAEQERAIAIFRETGLLEFIDAGPTFLEPGTKVVTTYPKLESEGATGGVITATVTPTTTVNVTPQATATITPTAPTTPTAPIKVWPTILTGSYLKSATAYRNSTSGVIGIQFELTTEGAKIFGDFTKLHADNDTQPFYYLSIALDKDVISSPHIKSAIPEGQGVIEGNFTMTDAQDLATQLRYGALPIPLRIETQRALGPSLGQDSVQRSIRAGVVGLAIVLLFMLVYYRLPGLLADLALILYGLINLAVYRAGWPVLLLVSLALMVSYLIDRRDTWALILGAILLVSAGVLGVSHFFGVTLTLPAITGFILSTGMAVDANILVFERMKEELRGGKSLGAAVEAGFLRAWTSIRDANISTLITCAILYYFGSSFGAGTVRGFAITLALGIVINLFTAITVTRTFVRLVYEWGGEKLRDSRLLAAD
jgi:preprotein translocase subunit SecD